MQYSFNQSTPKSSSQPEGEHIKKDKGKKALSLEEAEKESSDSDSNNDETHHIHLPEEKINQQKKIEEEAKAEAAKRETEDFITIKDLKDFTNTMLYTVQEIFFIHHQGHGLDDHAMTFSSLLLAEVDKRNLNPLKHMGTIKQLRE
ncbi:hypothetical protein Tco_1419940 [Tanacetum coccineum]